jgi:WD40 repeat protein
LRAFTPDEAPIFYGRDAETDDLIDKLRENRLVAVVAASGAGKSSLVGAGLIPRLKANAIEGSKDWMVPEMDGEPGQRYWIGLRFTPGELGADPFMALANKLSPMVSRTPRGIAEMLTSDPRSITELLDPLFVGKPAWAEALIFIDQFEELYTLADERYRTPFIEMLVAIAGSVRTRAILTLRADFYARCVENGTLAALLKTGTLPLSTAGPAALYEMISKPAERAGLTFEPGLVDRILRDTGSDPGALALLAYALDELYNTRDGDVLTEAAYDALGGVQRAIGERAENIYENLPESAHAGLQDLFHELVEVDAPGEPTRRRAAKGRITGSPSSAELVRRFTDARLLVEDRRELGEGVVEVAHEALLRTWSRLVEWIVNEESDLRLRRQVEQSARDWQSAPDATKADFLLAGGRLQEATNLLKRYPAENYVQQYITASTDAETARRNEDERRKRELQVAASRADVATERAKEASARASRRTRIAVGVIALAVFVGVVAVILISIAQNDRVAAQQQADEAGRTVAAANTTLTPVGSTLTAVGSTLVAGNNQLATATIAQGRAERGATSAFGVQQEAQTAAVAAQQAQSTAVIARNAAQTVAVEAQVQSTNAMLQAQRAQQDAADAQTAVGYAQTQMGFVAATLTPIAPTLTAIAGTLSGAQQAGRNAQTDIAVIQSTLTPIPITLTAVDVTLQAGLEAAADGSTQVAEVQRDLTQIAPAQTQIAQAIATLTPIQETLVAAQLTAVVAEERIGEADARAETSDRQAIAARLFSVGSDLLTSESTDNELAALFLTTSLSMNYSPEADYALGQLINSLTTTLYIPNIQSNRGDEISLSPDGTRLWVVQNENLGTITLWDTTTGQQMRVLTLDVNMNVFGLWVAPDGETAVTALSELLVVDLNTGEILHELVGTSAPRLIEKWNGQFSSDGSYFVALEPGDDTSPSNIYIWDVKTGSLVYKTSYLGLYFTGGIAIQNERIAIPVYTSEGLPEVQVLSLESGTLLQTYVSPYLAYPIYEIQYSPNGDWLAAVDMLGNFTEWDVATGNIRAHGQDVHGTVRIVYLPTVEGFMLHTFVGDESAKFITVRRTGEFSSSYIRLYGSTHNSYNLVQVGYEDGITRFAFVDTQTFEGRVWSTNAGVIPDPLPTGLAYSADGQRMLIISSEDGSGIQRGIAERATLRPIVSNLEGDVTVYDKEGAFSPDGTQVAQFGDYAIRAWNAETGEVLWSYSTRDQEFSIEGIGYSLDGTRVMVARRKEFVVLDATSGRTLNTFEMKDEYGSDALVACGAVLFSPDGKFFSSPSCSSYLYVIDAETGVPIKTFSTDDTYAISIAFSPDTPEIAVGMNDGSIAMYLLRYIPNRTVFNFLGHTDSVSSLAFSPDGRYLLSVSQDQTTRLWDATDGREVRRVYGSYSLPALFSPDGTRFYAGDGNLDYRAFVELACTCVYRDFTREERIQYGIPDDVQTCMQRR